MPRTPRSAHKALVMQAIRTLQRIASRVPEVEAVIVEVFFLFPFCYFLLQFTWLPNEIGVYDLIVMLSLQRLSNPKGKKFWVIIRFWETIHLLLPQANMNT